MSMSKALTFFKKVKNDSDFRKSCYHYDSKQVLLKEEGFTEVEFDDAVNMNLVKCQTYEEADEVKHVKEWFSIL